MLAEVSLPLPSITQKWMEIIDETIALQGHLLPTRKAAT